MNAKQRICHRRKGYAQFSRADDSHSTRRYTRRLGSLSTNAPSAMISSVQIHGYRSFSSFEMGGLGRINLLVGTNNSGKTSVLEALHLLASGGSPNALWRVIARRGERLFIDAPDRREQMELDVSHIFHGHELRIGTNFSITTKNKSPFRSIKFAIAEASKEGAQERLLDGDGVAPSIVLNITGTPPIPYPIIPLTRQGGMRSEALDMTRRGQGRNINLDAPPVQFISTESLGQDELAAMWNRIALTDAEQRVVKALQFIEPSVERIAPNIPTSPYYYGGARGGFIVKLSDSEQPIPIGSLGDGSWRLLALAIALSRAKDGILLIDEIDTGLHYTVMADMWRLIWETARLLNIQVFATTHSYDCVHSLSTICRADVTANSEVTLQRIDPKKKKSTPFTEAEIKTAAEREIEVR